jgi:hypothetical protein
MSVGKEREGGGGGGGGREVEFRIQKTLVRIFLQILAVDRFRVRVFDGGGCIWVQI